MNFKLIHLYRRSSLLSVLICLTTLFIINQILLFITYYKITEIVDSLVNASLSYELLYPVVFFPLFLFLFLQLLAYGLLIAWVWFGTVSFCEYFNLSKRAEYFIGILYWLIMIIAIVALNYIYFPNSFFSKIIYEHHIFKKSVEIFLTISVFTIVSFTFIAYLNFFKFKRHCILAFLFLLLGTIYVGFSIYNELAKRPIHTSEVINGKPNIILIGLDSLRPDFTGFFGNAAIYTPHIDSFLQSSVTFSNAYTPLARTFPAWISILTAKYPKHNLARNNLVDSEAIMKNDTLSQHFKNAGYETIYATDEKRFSNIIPAYGFDHVVGPRMGVDDFLLSGLSDFPLTNLLINLPFGQYIFPFNFGNRAAAITYEPNNFLKLINFELNNKHKKPLFLAVHLCLAHWPFLWADKKTDKLIMPEQYKQSVEALDKQFGNLLDLLKKQGLLQNSIIVLLSDHGTGLGLLGDRIIFKENYVGDRNKIKLITLYTLSNAQNKIIQNKSNYTISTSYGQGTNVLSLSQYRVLLAFKSFQDQNWVQKKVETPSMLIDIAPTLLDILKLPAMTKIDGVSLKSVLTEKASTTLERPFFFETGDSMTEIETDHIYIEKVIKHEIGIYHIDPKNGLLAMDKRAEESIIKNKQLAILWKDWILARYPAHMERSFAQSNGAKGKLRKTPSKFVSALVPAYFVLANTKTGQWTIGFSSALAKKAPVDELLQKLKYFYGSEVKE